MYGQENLRAFHVCVWLCVCVYGYVCVCVCMCVCVCRTDGKCAGSSLLGPDDAACSEQGGTGHQQGQVQVGTDT